MVGFLLRVHVQIILLYILLNSIPAVFIVTLGGKFLGITIIALLSSILQSELLKKISPIYTSMILLVGTILLVYFLPGYVVINPLGTIFILGLLLIIHLGLRKYIKDR